MAEFIFRHIAKEMDIDASVSSAGVSSEEEGNGIYPPTMRVLKKHGIPFSFHRAHRITDSEFHSNDLVIALDSSNLRALQRRFGDDARIRMLLDRDVDDPWYTDDFDTAYEDIEKGCMQLARCLASGRRP